MFINIKIIKIKNKTNIKITNKFFVYNLDYIIKVQKILLRFNNIKKIYYSSDEKN